MLFNILFYMNICGPCRKCSSDVVYLRRKYSQSKVIAVAGYNIAWLCLEYVRATVLLSKWRLFSPVSLLSIYSCVIFVFHWYSLCRKVLVRGPRLQTSERLAEVTRTLNWWCGFAPYCVGNAIKEIALRQFISIDYDQIRKVCLK